MNILLFLSILGILDSLYLSSVHLMGSGACLPGVSFCNPVLSSPYSRIMGIPLSTLGIGVYCVLLFFSWRGKDIQKRAEALHWIFNISLFGTLVSAYLTYVQAKLIQQWCIFCLISAVIMTTIFLLSLNYKLRKERPPFFQFPNWKLALKMAVILLLLPVVLFQSAEFIKERWWKEETVVAQIGEWIIGVEEIDRSLGIEIYQLDEARYKMRRQWLENKLLSLEADKRKLTLEELLANIYSPIKVTQDEIENYFNIHQHKSHEGLTDKIRQQIASSIKMQKKAMKREQFIEQLKKKHKVSFALQRPNPFTFAPNPRLGPVKGANQAKVTIIEFSDFSCPPCKTANKRLQELLAQYPKSIRIIFRHSPLSPKTQPAHNAAACAHIEGKFWPYAERLFKNQGKFSESKLYEYAKELHLDMSKWGACMESGQGEKAVAADIKEGRALGLKRTPSIFINGRFFSGLPSYYQLKKMLDEAIKAKQ